MSPTGDMDLAVALFVRRSPERFLPTVASVRQSLGGVPLLLGTPGDPAVLEELVAAAGDPAIAAAVRAFSAGELVNLLADRTRTHVLALDDVVVLPGGMLDRALWACDDDPRIVSVSFLSNAAGYLSFPHHNTPVHHQIEDFDEDSLTRRLRDLGPAVGLVPIPYATGAAVLFPESALVALGPLRGEEGHRLEVQAAELSLRGTARGMVSVLDAETFYSRPYDLALLDQPTFLEAAERSWLIERHPFASGVLDHNREDGSAPRTTAMRVARVKALGLRLLIDGSCLGPKEMGTQVQTLSLVAELADHPAVASIGVGLPGAPPRYAEKVLGHPKIDARRCPPNDFTTFGHVDLAHRPFQPEGVFDPVAWRRTAVRSVVTMQDLIGYQVPAYHASDERWFKVRADVRRAVSMADGVIVISHDTHRQLRMEALPVEPDRTFVVENGTDHLTGNEPEELPRELVRRGFAAGDFVLVLGANYGHKNRDLAIRALRELRHRGHDLSLVAVGAQVPHGSVRHLEARALLEHQRDFGSAEHLILLPDVTSEERNWLLRHARLVLYPTSAEGFGLVPFEAAVFGTATVAVGFGPVAEVAPDLPVHAAGWAPEDLADAAERLLADGDLYDRQVQAIRLAGSSYTWRRTADLLVDAYRTVLARPPRLL